MIIDYIFQFIKGNIAVRLLTIVNLGLVTPLLLRTLSVEDYGYYGYIVSFIMMVALFLSMGTNEYATVYVATYEDDKKKSNVLYSLLCGRLLMTPIILGVWYWAFTTDMFTLNVDADYVPIVLIGALVFSLAPLMEIKNRLFHLTSYYSYKFIYLLMNIVAMAYIIWQSGDTYTLLILEVAINIILGIAIVWIMVKTIPLSRPDFGFFKNKITQCGILFINAGVWSLLVMADKFFLLHYTDRQSLGLYNLGSIIVSGLMVLVFITTKDMMLNFAAHATRVNDKDYQQKVHNAFIVIFPVMIMPFILGLSLYGKPFVVLYGGADFMASHQYIIWLGLGYFVYQFASFFFEKQMMRNDSYIKILSFITLFLLFINIPANIIFIQKYGAIGAAYATFLTLTLGAGIILYIINSKTDEPINLLSCFKLWCILLGVYALGYALWDNDYGIIGTLIFCAVSWGAVIVASCLFKDSRELFLWLFDRIQKKRQQS